MNLNFEDFLNSSKEDCRTKDDFLFKIRGEMELVNAGIDLIPLSKDIYLSRLKNAEFCIEKGVFRERDIFNSAIIDLLDRLK